MVGKSTNLTINLWGQSIVPCTQPLTNTHLNIFYHGKHRLKNCAYRMILIMEMLLVFISSGEILFSSSYI